MSKKDLIGNIVKWRCSPYGGKSFIAEGIVRELVKTSFGGIRNNIFAVKIEPIGEYRKVFPNRKTTTIALKNLI